MRAGRLLVALMLTARVAAADTASSIEQVEPPRAVRTPAIASSEAESLRLGWWLDGSMTGAAVAALGFSTLISVDHSSTWRTQLLPFDDRLEGRYSPKAARLSDTILGIDVAVPVALFAGRGFDRDSGKRVFVYAETLLVALALDATVKPLVGRPRPYTYSNDPTVIDFARTQGRDAHLSFYSGHASTTFAASVAGAYLFAQSSSDANARAAVWGVELAMASATADLRTRAGMHFYSDVLAGALVGSSLGVLVPYLHGGPKVHLSKMEWLAIVLGPLAGIALGELLPASGQ
jgi:membrane-associated phospholipid phosphatase